MPYDVQIVYDNATDLRSDLLGNCVVFEDAGHVDAGG